MNQMSDAFFSSDETPIGPILVIDKDSRRRATLSRTLSTVAYAVPLESVAELAASKRRATGALVVFDDGEVLRDLVTIMDEGSFWIPFIGYHDEPSAQRVVEAVNLGAVDYWQVPVTETLVRDRIPIALDRGKGAIRQKAREAVARQRLSALTHREREVIAAVSMGYSNKEIGKALGISSRTVEVHRASMKERIDIQTTAEAIRLMLEAGLN